MGKQRSIRVEVIVENEKAYTNILHTDKFSFPENISDEELSDLLASHFDDYLDIINQDILMKREK